MDICLVPATIPTTTKENVVDCLIFQKIRLVVTGELDIGPRTDNLPPKEEILGVMLKDMGLCLKISTTCPC